MSEGVEIGTAYVTILPDGSKIGPEVKKSFGAVDAEAAKVGQTSGKKFGGMFSRSSTAGAGQAGATAGKKFGGLFSSTASKVIGAAGGAFAATKLFNFLGDSLDEAREAAQVGRRTDNVIRSMGNASKVSAKQVGDLAGAISSKIGVDDEAIQSGENLLLTFGKVRNETGKGNKIFNRATGLMADMSAAMGTDMKGSAIQLGKALNDPIKGMSALSRVGVSFSEEQKNTVKSLIEGGEKNAVFAMSLVENNEAWSDALKANKGDIEATVKVLTKNLDDTQRKRFNFLSEGGHQLEAQKIILGEVDKQFKGAGKAMADPAKKLQVAYGNLKEQIGTALLPTVQDLEGFMTRKVIPAVSTFLDQMKTGKGKGGRAVELFQTIREDAEKAVGFVKGIGKAFDHLPDPIKKGILVGGASLAAAKKTGILGAAGSLRGATPLTPMFVKVVGGLGTKVPAAAPVAAATGSAAAAEGGAGALAARAAVTGRLALAKFGAGGALASAGGVRTYDLTKDNPLGLKALPFTPDLLKFASRATEIQNGVKAVEALDKSLAGLAMRRPGQALAEFKSTARLTGQSTEDLAKQLPAAAEALRRAGIDAKNADGKVFGLKESTHKAAKELVFLGQQQPRVTIRSNADKVKRDIFSVTQALKDAEVPRTAHLRLAISQNGTGFGLQARANGGPIEPNRPYLVGERGPELRTFNRSGSIVPNHALGGPGVQVNIERVEAHDYDDFMRQAQSRARRAQMGGF